MVLRTDEQLGDFLTYLDQHIPGGMSQCVVAVTSDHGVQAVPEQSEAQGLLQGKGRYQTDRLASAMEAALERRYGKACGGRGWLGGERIVENFVYLDDQAVREVVDKGQASLSEIEATAAQGLMEAAPPQLYAVYTRSQVLSGLLPRTAIGEAVTLGCHPLRTGNLILIDQPLCINGLSKADHGSPYSANSHVPLLLAGWHIRHGVWPELVHPLDLAPTLAALLGIAEPTCSEGRILRSAMKP